MKMIRAPENVTYTTVKNDGLQQIMLVLRNTSVQKPPLYKSKLTFGKMQPFKGEQLSLF